MSEHRDYTCPKCFVYTSSEPLPIPKGVKETAIKRSVDYRQTLRPRDIYATDFFDFFENHEYSLTICPKCGQVHFWKDNTMVFPLGVKYQPPKTMPEDARKLFIEAQKVLTISPRAACVLSRVCLECIVDTAGTDVPDFKPNDPLYKKILSLNLGENMRIICDACRLTGNAGAHAGTVVFSEQDGKDIAGKLFLLIDSLTRQLLEPKAGANALLEIFGKKH